MDRKNESPSTSPSTPALLLVAHGSARNQNARSSVEACAERLRASGRFAEIHCAFLKEEPGLAGALERVSAADVVVVPFFVSGGYYTNEVIPRELGLSGASTRFGGRTVRLTEPVGAHPAIAELIVRRAREAGAVGGDCLAVLGHGTQRNPDSATNVLALAERIRATGVFAEVVTVFLDQEPRMLDAWDMTTCYTMAMVPLFVAAGWHVDETIPADLEAAGVSTRPDRRLLLADPVGTHPDMCRVVMDLARPRDQPGWAW